jgi:hypothetical protein
VLRRIVIEQLDDVRMHVEKPDLDLQALFERLRGVSYAQAAQDDVNGGAGRIDRHLRRARARC